MNPTHLRNKIGSFILAAEKACEATDAGSEVKPTQAEFAPLLETVKASHREIPRATGEWHWERQTCGEILTALVSVAEILKTRDEARAKRAVHSLTAAMRNTRLVSRMTAVAINELKASLEGVKA